MLSQTPPNTEKDFVTLGKAISFLTAVVRSTAIVPMSPEAQILYADLFDVLSGPLLPVWSQLHHVTSTRGQDVKPIYSRQRIQCLLLELLHLLTSAPLPESAVFCHMKESTLVINLTSILADE